MQVIVDNLPISYSVLGEGQTIVILHGWGDSSTSFTNLAKALSTDYKVVLVDLPGFGGSGVPQTILSLEDFAKFVGKFLRKISVDEVYAFIGHSNGGAIAISGLAEKVFKSEKLVLLASAGIRDDKKLKKTVLKHAAKTAKVATKILPNSLQEKIRKKSYEAIGSEMYVNAEMQETFKAVVGEDVQSAAKKLKLPTLLIYGSNDTSTPPKYGKLLAECIKGSKYVELKGVDHFVHVTAQQDVEEQIRKFL